MTALVSTPVTSTPNPTEATTAVMVKPAASGLTTAPVTTAPLPTSIPLAAEAAVPPPTDTAIPLPTDTAMPPAVTCAPGDPGSGANGTRCEVAAAEQYTIDLINAQRAAAGIPPLLRDETLMGIARARVADMVARGYTGHSDPVTGEPLAQAMMRAAGYTSTYLGENWYGTIQGPPAIVDIAMGWFMTDPPHANNILSLSYVAVGVGIAFNGRQWLLVQDFAGQ